jgi:hypothetical protein
MRWLKPFILPLNITASKEYPMAKDNFRRPTDLPLPPLLISESDEEFNALREALYKELRPNGIIERMYVEEFVDLAWQIARLKRCKAGVINLAFHQASKNILWELLEAGPDVARDWIFYPKMGKQVEAGLASYKLDSSVIIAEAIKAKAFELARSTLKSRTCRNSTVTRGAL